MALLQLAPPQIGAVGSASPNFYLDTTAVAFIRALDTTKECIMNIGETWASPRQFQMELMESLLEHSTGRNFKSALYWLFLRHELGAALVSDISIQIPLPSLPPYPAEGEFGPDPFEREFCFANHPLWLCARAIKFIHNEDTIPQYPPMHMWTQLIEELQHWYQGRSPRFQAMLELEMDRQESGLDQTFPIVLFGNGAGVFSNQLYHTAMLILLNNRPRTAPTADYHSAAMSPSWHAQRICSIALNNERRECWDPCLLASFITAARRMTHEAQQQEILGGLSIIQETTGWNFGGLVGCLRNEWSILAS
ncbi:hypothetical protein N7468_002640 [Penicillium chermesinum]|uniref:Uncharacterized protein n=1 Tax=Penicillium chermesinum TaxID=63820 RepID=A0A9W9TY58_9EURO|nr:uncharacterized protein N7468_002640 [Penicillium chermesinum]KAJ5247657.1 hypothetical protein N7468_002640 [Penicillium chermesinum]KAJ6151425.1 hypothetical protein N7470_007022 [Penicillium chermesinum]